MNTIAGAEPYAELRFRDIKGKRMAYIDEGQGDATVFQHGNPASSYLWRNVMPHPEGLGRLVACDVIGMAVSEKLSPSGSARYHYAEQREYLFDLWDALELGHHVVLVLHDWGSALGFDWANQHRDRVQGITFMEAISTPMTWVDWPDPVRAVRQGFRSPEGERTISEQNMFVDEVLPGGIRRQLTDEEMDDYREPFRNPGEDRRPTLSWPRQHADRQRAGRCRRDSQRVRQVALRKRGTQPCVNAEPGKIVSDRIRKFIRTWPNQIEVTVKGSHFIQQDNPDEIGTALAEFARGLRPTKMTGKAPTSAGTRTSAQTRRGRSIRRHALPALDRRRGCADRRNPQELTKKAGR